MEQLDALAERLGVSRNVLLAAFAGVIVLVAWYIRKHAPSAGNAVDTSNTGNPPLYTVTLPLSDIINGPWASGDNGAGDTTSANPSGNGTSPNGGSDPTNPPATAATHNYATSLVLSKKTSLQDIAAQYGVSLAWLKSWNNQISNLSGFNKPWWTLPAGTQVNIPHAA